MITHSSHTKHGHNKGWAEAQCLDLDGQKYLVSPNEWLILCISSSTVCLLYLCLLWVMNFVSLLAMPTYLGWPAQYLVRRAGIEPNLHALYMAGFHWLLDGACVVRNIFSDQGHFAQPFVGPILKNLAWPLA